MRRTLFIAILLGVLCPSAGSAGTIWDFAHAASGEGWASVFDGGPPVHDSEAETGPDDTSVRFLALDRTINSPPAMVADADASGRSVIGIDDNIMIVSLNFRASYTPSFDPNGDRPGGTSEGSFMSVVEFAMPADELDWSAFQRVQLSAFYSGRSTIVVENVSAGEDLIAFTEEDKVVGLEHMTLSGQEGDIIRISSEMSGAGSVPAGPVGLFRFDVNTDFMFTHVPEPGALALLALGSLLTRRRRR